MTRFRMAYILALLMISGCARRPPWVLDLGGTEGQVRRQYDVRHFLADDYFDFTLATSGTSSGGSAEPDRELALFEQVRAIQSRKILALVRSCTANIPPGIKTKNEWIQRVRYLPITEESPGVYVLEASEREHQLVLECFVNLRPQYAPEDLAANQRLQLTDDERDE